MRVAALGPLVASSLLERALGFHCNWETDRTGGTWGRGCVRAQVYGAGSEDMDTLTFNSPVVLRHLTFSEARKMPIDVISLDEVLAGLELTMDQVRPFPQSWTRGGPDSHTRVRVVWQFIDMCMLCGCDYLEPLKGIGAKTALKLVREYDDMDAILDHLRKGKNPPPDEWPYQEARELFKHPDVKKAAEIEVSQFSSGRGTLGLIRSVGQCLPPSPLLTAQVGSA